MPYRSVVLTEEDLRAFADHGYLVVPGAVPPDVVAGANAAVDRLLAEQPPPAGHVGPYSPVPGAAATAELTGVLSSTAAWDCAQALVGSGQLEVPTQVQVALNIPPFPHRPARHHLDGLNPLDPDGRPWTFTLLAGVLLTDQTAPDCGNLWVWPGTHLRHAAYFRAKGPDALLASAADESSPPIGLPEPAQVRGRAGDLLLAHYLLAHNIGGNVCGAVRRALYYRIHRHGHRARWREFVTDAWHDYDTVRAIVG
jgi:hypothetical protein